MIRTKKFEDLPQITSISPSGKILVVEQGIDKVISFEDFSNLPATNDIWNNASTTFTASEVNVTDIQSAADSKLLDLKVNTTSKFVVRKDGNLGIGVTNPAARLDISDTVLAGSGSLAGSALNLAQTWNTTGAPTAVKVVVTDQASDAASNLLELWAGSTPSLKTKIDKLGIITANRLILNQSGSFLQLPANNAIYWLGTSFLRSSTAGVFSFENNTGSNYFTLVAEDANALAQRNSVNPQTFRLYNTYTNATTFERLNIKWDTNVLKLGTEKGSAGGTARDLVLETDGLTRMTITSAGNVGIGVANPTDKLSIETGYNGVFSIKNNGFTSFSIANNGGAASSSFTNGIFTFSTGGTRIIGTTFGSIVIPYEDTFRVAAANFNTGAKFQLITNHGSNAAGTNTLEFLSNNMGAATTGLGSVNASISNSLDNTIKFSVAESISAQGASSNLREVSRFNGSGYLGIGLSNPVAKLDIAETWNSNIAVTGASGTGSVATITFSTQSVAIPVGSTIVVASVNPAGYNGTFVVTASSVTSVSYANATTTTYVSGGTVQQLFTAVKVNVTDTASNANSKLLDLQVGGTSKFKIFKNGMFTHTDTTGNFLGIYSNGNVTYFISSDDPLDRSMGFNHGSPTLFLPNNGRYAWTSQARGQYNTSDSADLFLTRRGAANLRIGATDAAAPVAQTLSVQSVIAGTTNTAGANFTIDGSQGTGTGIGGSILFRTAPAGSSGTAVNALATALTINSTGKATFAPTINSSNSFEITNLAGSPIVTIDSTNRRFNAGGGALSVSTSTGATTLYDAAYLGWQDASVADQGTSDLRLYRDASNSLALRNGVNPQAFRLYNTFTDSSNYERAFIKWDSGILKIGTEASGTGALRSVEIFSTGVKAISLENYQVNIHRRMSASLDTGGNSDISGTVLYINNLSSNTNSSGLFVKAGNAGGTGYIAKFESRLGNQSLFLESSGNIGVGTTTPTEKLDVIGNLKVSGHFSATTKSFLIPHPTKPDKKLQYACLEGPENGVYIRGKTNEPIILLPDYWSELVDADSITVTVTPIGKPQQLFVVSQNSTSVEIGNVDGLYNYLIFAERKDVNKLQTEI